jgi:uncharacterized RDD family membrane protein YckC
VSDPNTPPPPAAPPPAAPPPPQQGWQSQPQQPGPPPAGGGMGSSMPSWTSNITDRNTIAGPAGTALGSVGERVVALIIDQIIVGLVGFVLFAILGNFFTTTTTEQTIFGPIQVTTVSPLGNIITTVLIIGISAAYYIYQWTRMNGQTVGMRLFKLSVRDAATGAVISQNQAIYRWGALAWPLFAYFLPFVGFIISLLGLAWYIFLLVTTAQDPMRQGWHDKFAKTVVAKLAM